MINLPILDRLDIVGYGLYPGRGDNKPGLHIKFQPGLTLILGANGLGKTTLVNILYRLLAGPFDIRGLSERTDLGSGNLQPTSSSVDRALFRRRVSDGARAATAELRFNLGSHKLVVERSLHNLSLTRFSVDGKEFSPHEDAFLTEVPKLVGVWSFGDWVLLLRYLTFYFEDRRALVWDASAQRQVLRFLLLSVDIAQKWSEDEREILALDSQARNLSTVIFQQESRLSDVELKLDEGVDVRAELKALEQLQQIDGDLRERLDEEFLQRDSQRDSARLRFLKAQQERETRYRVAERAKLIAIETRFPGKSDTARYILAQLMTENDCLVCGNRSSAAAATLEQRIERQQCVVCGSDMAGPPQASAVSSTTELADFRVGNAMVKLAEIEPELAEAQVDLEQIEKQHSGLRSEITSLDARMSGRSARINALVGRLPPAEMELHENRSSLVAMRGHLVALRAELDDKRSTFSAFVEEQNRAMVDRSEAIRYSFAHYAQGFLLEECTLIWSPQKARIGQSGTQVEFPAFELEMSGAANPSPVRRTAPEQVSESQREFIDLAFRMALMQVAGSDGLGSLIIDAPESSLDAVFSKRAAAVLSRFALPNVGNRLVVMSNLVEGQLIPTLLQRSATADGDFSRLVNLFDIAEPTVAIRALSEEYGDALAHLLAAAKAYEGSNDPDPVRTPSASD